MYLIKKIAKHFSLPFATVNNIQPGIAGNILSCHIQFQLGMGLVLTPVREVVKHLAKHAEYHGHHMGRHYPVVMTNSLPRMAVSESC